jgi:glycosyltransferase involved in cell wall biosynthesis
VNHKRLSVSLVIPAYNEQRHLLLCLEAVASQTMPPDEVIVVDNNSTDDTGKIAKQYSFVTLIREPRQGIVFARNAGFNAATGDIIGRIDADTIVPKDWIEHITNFYKNTAHQHDAWSGGGSFYNVRFSRFVSGVYNFLVFEFNRLLLGHYTLWGSNMALLKSQWLAVSDKVCGRIDIHEDLDLSIHLSQAGYNITYDRHIKTRTHLREIQTNRYELWQYLQWWPRTLKIHRRRNWVICWLFGCLLLYILTPLLSMAEWLAQRFGKQPLPED